MKTRIVRIAQGKEGVELPEDFLRELELIPGAEVELVIDKKRKWIVVRPLHGEDFLEHFKESMEHMA
jgi:antitoxin component of MazEF toxin-antitoxin module